MVRYLYVDFHPDHYCFANNFFTFTQPNSEIHIHWKGAAEIVLACCTGYIDVNDQLMEMDEEKV